MMEIVFHKKLGITLSLQVMLFSSTYVVEKNGKKKEKRKQNHYLKLQT